jgi:hypothetical protein
MDIWQILCVILLLIVIVFLWTNRRLYRECRFWRGSFSSIVTESYRLVDEMVESVGELIEDGEVKEDAIYANLMSEEQIQRFFDERKNGPSSTTQKLDKHLAYLKQRSNEMGYTWVHADERISGVQEI